MRIFRLHICLLVLLGVLISCGEEGVEVPVPNVSFEQKQPVNMEFTLLDELEQFMQKGKYSNMSGVLVFRNNQNIYEKYYNDYHQDSLIPLHKATRVVVSALMGIAIDRGELSNEDEVVTKFFPEYASSINDKEQVTIHHILSNSSRIETNQDWRNASNPDSVILHSELIGIPGEQYKEDDAMPYLLGRIIEKASGCRLDSFAKKVLFQPLGIKHWKWETDDFGRMRGDGLKGSLWLSTRDLAKVALLYLNNGQWGQQQVISDQWIQSSFLPWMYMSFDYHQGYMAKVMNRRTTIPDLYNSRVITVTSRYHNLFFLPENKTLVIIPANEIIEDRSLELLTHYFLPTLFPGKSIPANESYTYNAQLIEDIEVDGHLDEWANIPGIAPNNPIKKRSEISASDYSPTVKIAWNRRQPTRIYMGIEIIDDVCQRGGDFKDRIEVTFDFSNQGRSYRCEILTTGAVRQDVAIVKRSALYQNHEKYCFEIEFDPWRSYNFV